MIIKGEFKPSYGEFVKVRNINFESLDEFRKNCGEGIAISHSDDNENFELNEEGAYICRSKYDFSKALKIYKDINFYKYTYHGDYKVVSMLQQKQPNVKLSEFPTGILTIEDYIIGQEITLYDNSETLHDYFISGNMKKRSTEFYLDILKILKELCNQGIIYKDVHRRNFMINKMTEIVNIIDFDSAFLNFDNSKSAYDAMLRNLKSCIIGGLYLIKSYELVDNFRASFDGIDNLEELEQLLLKADYKLKIK